MATSDTLNLTKLTATVGAEVLDVDVDRVREDPDLPQAVLEALEENGVLVFRGLHLDDVEQVRFNRKMGELVTFPDMEIPEVWVITLDVAKNPMAEYLKATEGWHIDGTMDPVPAKATMLSAKVLSATGGETEFASTYSAYEDLGTEEQERCAGLRVHHSQLASQGGYLDPSDERHAKQLAKSREHPLVWTHDSGRRSLVIGHSADYVLDMDLEEGRALLADLNQRATRPERVYRHRWGPGDTVMWDNCGVVHRVEAYDAASGREMHRTTLVGSEAIR